jgi:aryl-alcohol dehydrogenase-like predicted oxidoreductase
MNCVNKLVLGTVQFGLDYGINNQFGQVHQDEVGQILRWAKKSGINTFDTSLPMEVVRAF